MHRAGFEGAQPGDGIHNIALAIPLDSGDAEDLARSDRKTQTIEGIAPDTSRHQFAHFEDGVDLLFERCSVYLDGADVVAGHRPGQRALIEVASFDFDDFFPLANHGDSIGDLSDLRQLVGDQHDRMTAGAQIHQNAQQILNLPGSEQ